MHSVNTCQEKFSESSDLWSLSGSYTELHRLWLFVTWAQPSREIFLRVCLSGSVSCAIKCVIAWETPPRARAMSCCFSRWSSKQTDVFLSVSVLRNRLYLTTVSLNKHISSSSTMTLAGKTFFQMICFWCVLSWILAHLLCLCLSVPAYREKMRELPLLSLFCSCIRPEPRDDRDNKKEGQTSTVKLTEQKSFLPVFSCQADGFMKRLNSDRQPCLWSKYVYLHQYI